MKQIDLAYVAADRFREFYKETDFFTQDALTAINKGFDTGYLGSLLFLVLEILHEG